MFWGSVQLVDRGNVKNTFGLAVGLAVVYDVAHLVAIPDVFYLGAWLVFLLRLVTWHYVVSLFGAVIVTAATILAPYFLVPLLVSFVGDSELRAYLVLYGLPIGVFGTWLVTAVRRRRRASEPVQGGDAAFPTARVQRGGRARVAKPPAVVAAPDAAPVAAPIAAPKAPEPVTPRSDGGPTFLT